MVIFSLMQHLNSKSMLYLGRWKTPVGYFLINGIDADIQSRLVQTAIRLGEENNLRIRAVTADATNVNPATMMKLGVKYADDEISGLLNKDFTFGRDIYFLLDVCHLIKLARNALASILVRNVFIYVKVPLNECLGDVF